MAKIPNECRHIMPNGERCQSPALRGTNYCYFHSSLIRIKTHARAKEAPLALPDLEDPSAIQVALSQAASAVAAGKLDPAQASVLLRILRFASDSFYRSPRFASRLAVDNVCESAEGEPIASDQP